MQAYADYSVIMELTEQIIASCSQAVLGTTDATYQGQAISLATPFRRASMHQLVQDATGRSHWPPSVPLEP